MKIETGVPLPAPTRKSGGQAKYPWHDMEVGDSFFVSKADVPNIFNFRRNVYANSKNGRKYTSRHVEGGVRVWRIE